jgi:hypothetical protein
MRIPVVLIALLGLSAPSALAVIVAGTDGTINTTAPGNGAPWDHVGTISGGASGIFLGSYGGGYWVITATHVGLGDISLNNVTYTAVGGSGLQIGGGDVFVYRISSNPGLSNLTLSSAAPANGSSVTMVGYGLDRTTSSLTGLGLGGWTLSGPSNNLTWTEIPSGAADAIGYFEAGTHTMRWGTNNIDGTTSYDIGTGSTSAIYTTFSFTTGEAQGSSGDSGGAMFYLNGGTWELAGIMGAIGTLNNQPGSTAIIGDATYAADISVYRTAILTAIPEPVSTTTWIGISVALAVGVIRRRRA